MSSKRYQKLPKKTNELSSETIDKLIYDFDLKIILNNMLEIDYE